MRYADAATVRYAEGVKPHSPGSPRSGAPWVTNQTTVYAEGVIQIEARGCRTREAPRRPIIHFALPFLALRWLVFKYEPYRACCNSYREAVLLQSPGSRRSRAPWVQSIYTTFTPKAVYMFRARDAAHCLTTSV